VSDGQKYAANRPRGPGRPSSYKPEYVEQAEKLCKLGATDAEIANFFQVEERTINRWKRDHPEFCQSLKRGKTLADAKVAERLYRRAVGYSHESVKIFNNGGEPLVVPYVEHYPPDTAAAIFWLKNRQSAKWRDKHNHEHSGLGKGPIQHEDGSAQDALIDKLEAMAKRMREP
jgi:hypothetical protein